jgi:hypothetical protein
MRPCKKRVCGAVGFSVGLALLTGCASPGPPLPPSLKLPQVPADLAAERTGDQVTLRWTTPSRTTDKLEIAGPMVAEICREAPASPVPAAVGATASAGSGRATEAQPCAPVVDRLKVTPGESLAVDTLPESLTSGPPALAAYRVQLRNALGRTAGASGPAFAPLGAGPEAVDELRSRATKTGVVLEWRPARAESSESSRGAAGDGHAADAVELDRVALDPPGPSHPAGAAGTLAGLAGRAKEPVEVRLRVDAERSGSASGAGDEGGKGEGGTREEGGMIDRTAQLGRSYRYTAQRVRTVTLGGRTLEVRSVASGPVTVAMPGHFAPDAPVGLLAAPGLDGVGDEARRPSIDLSWKPAELETNAVAGYRVYRREVEGGAPGGWQPVGAGLVAVPAYRDRSVAAGRQYAYRVTAVDAAGEESAPSAEATETAPTP